MKWFIPSHNGDHRLEAVGEDRCRLTVIDPTPHEIKDILTPFMADMKSLGYSKTSTIPVSEAILDAPIGKIAPILAGYSLPKDRTISAVRYEGGRVEVVEGTSKKLVELGKKVDGKLVSVGCAYCKGSLETKDSVYCSTCIAPHHEDCFGDHKACAACSSVSYVKAIKTGDNKTPVKDDKPLAAVSVKRPTPCCPQCESGSIGPATEVLLSFLTKQQHDDWSKKRVIQVEGGTTGHRYLVTHRNSRLAAKWGKICFDSDDRDVLHFHDWSVPPEEEVLATKLILENREHWLRNEATALGNHTNVLKNPFGGFNDGIESSSFTIGLGTSGMQLAEVFKEYKAQSQVVNLFKG